MSHFGQLLQTFLFQQFSQTPRCEHFIISSHHDTSVDVDRISANNAGYIRSVPMTTATQTHRVQRRITTGHCRCRVYKQQHSLSLRLFHNHHIFRPACSKLSQDLFPITLQNRDLVYQIKSGWRGIFRCCTSCRESAANKLNINILHLFFQKLFFIPNQLQLGSQINNCSSMIPYIDRRGSSYCITHQVAALYDKEHRASTNMK